jgi:checkpoint serine/threonine-protein kinase
MRPSLRSFDIMTPITEVSEDRTFAGISTIYSDKVRSSISGYDSNGSYCNPNGAENDILHSSFSRGEHSTESSKKNHDIYRSSTEVLNSLRDSDLEKENEGNYEMMDIPNPCNPYDATIINAILDSVPIPENSGLYSLMNETRGLQQELKSVLSGSKSKIDYVFQLGPKQRYKLVKKIAQGGYGQVYLVNNFKAGLLGEQEEDFTINCTFSSKKTATPQMALKLQSPPAPWEFYILSLLRSRLPNRVNDSIAKPISCYLFKDESFLLMEYRNQGTLLNCVNLADSGGYGAGSSCGTVSNGQSGVDELLAAFWTVELLRIIETVHAAGVIHGDVKVKSRYISFAA